jgi:hypothetical protein
LGKQEARMRRMECWRISSRRGADKLGQLKSFTLHHKRNSNNDEEAYQKVCKVLQPDRNLITRHAAEHAESWLDLKKNEFEFAGRFYNEESPLIGVREFTRMITKIFEINHKKLNKCFKDKNNYGECLISVRPCKPDDPCAQFRSKRVPEVWDDKAKQWLELLDSLSLTMDTIIRTSYRNIPYHEPRKCQNRVIILQRTDIEQAAKSLVGNKGLYKRSLNNRLFINKHNVALNNVLNLAKQLDVLPQRTLKAMENG